MFEKEAKNWVKENIRIEHSASFGDIKVVPYTEKGFQKGAEFGYNKCFQQIRKLVNEHTRLDCIIPELLRLQEIE